MKMTKILLGLLIVLMVFAASGCEQEFLTMLPNRQKPAWR